MNKLYQTNIDRRGNCWQAAVASVLGLRLDQVPDFMALDEKVNRWSAYIQFMKAQGVYVLTVPIHSERHLKTVCLYNRFAEGDVILRVAGKYDGIGHAVVGFFERGKIKVVHDPNPENEGKTFDDYTILGIDFLIADDNAAAPLACAGLLDIKTTDAPVEG